MKSTNEYKEIEIFSGSFDTDMELPYADAGVRAGFPSPAQDYMDRTLDFNKELIRHPAATFYAKVVGQSMIDAGIDEGDIVVIDRALDPRQGDVVVAYINGEFTMKYLDMTDKEHDIIWLRAGNPSYPDFRLTPDDDLRVWGVVSKVIKSFRK